jgi:hypothetical protein
MQVAKSSGAAGVDDLRDKLAQISTVDAAGSGAGSQTKRISDSSSAAGNKAKTKKTKTQTKQPSSLPPAAEEKKQQGNKHFAQKR